MLEAKVSTRLPLPGRTDFHDAPLLNVVDHCFEGIALVDPETRTIVYANATLREWLRISPHSKLPATINDILTAEGSTPLWDQFESTWRRDQSEITLCAQLRSAAGVCKPVKLRVCRLSLADGPLLGLILGEVYDDRASRDPVPEHRDPLTGLPDRAFLLSKLTALMDETRSLDRRFAVLFIDLDNFKQVNDRHGHLVGDRVLSIAAKRLSDSVRDCDYVVRFGGDEFVVLVEEVAAHSDIATLVSRIRFVLAEVISLPEGDFTLRMSVGTALASPEHRTPEDVLAAADRAMYAAKRANS